ncbi:hypothetical protein RIF29_33909 [Crotalaria pallida]|uniref:Uncharacterized protein n=1 Tax=Crotalaria pallida TaxID=3830 RepID=A0AAN9E9J8_CROPI
MSPPHQCPSPPPSCAHQDTSSAAALTSSSATPAVIAEPEPETKASSDSASSDSSDSSVAPVSPLAIAPQASLDSDSSFDLSDDDEDEDEDESTSSSEEGEQEGVQQAIEEEVQEPQQPQGEQHIGDVLGADIEEQPEEIDDPQDQTLLRSGWQDRYRDSLRRILELTLSMHQSGVLDPYAIQQIVDISSRPMGHVVVAATRGRHIPQRGG